MPTAESYIQLPCTECGCTTNCTPIAHHHHTKESFFHGQIDTIVAISDTIYLCSACQAISLLKEIVNSEDNYEPAPYLYPEPITGLQVMPGIEQLPARARQRYQHTLAAYNMGMLALTAASLRGVVKFVAKDIRKKQIPGYPLRRQGGEKLHDEKRLLQYIDQLPTINKDDAYLMHQMLELAKIATHEVGLGETSKDWQPRIPHTVQLTPCIAALERVLIELYGINQDTEASPTSNNPKQVLVWKQPNPDHSTYIPIYWHGEQAGKIGIGLQRVELVPTQVTIDTPLYCSCCETDTRHTPLFTSPVWNKTEQPTHTVVSHLMQCDTCSTTALLEFESVEEYGITQVLKTQLFPTPEFGDRVPVTEDILTPIESLPTEIFDVYVETVHAYNHHMLDLVEIGIRIILEAIANEQGIADILTTEVEKRIADGEKRDPFPRIEEKIDKLRQKNIITGPEKTMLTTLRHVGNEGLNKDSSVGKMRVSICLDMLERILTRLYIDPFQTQYYLDHASEINKHLGKN